MHPAQGQPLDMSPGPLRPLPVPFRTAVPIYTLIRIRSSPLMSIPAQEKKMRLTFRQQFPPITCLRQVPVGAQPERT